MPFMRARQPQGNIMTNLRKLVLVTSLAALCGLAASAQAAEIERSYAPGSTAPIAAGVSVPPGYTTYYISGALPSPVKPAANGQPADYGDMETQTRSVLNNLKTAMARMGVGFGDVVQAHVYLDPAGDTATMNRVWSTEFGTAAQPNKPARATVKVNALVAPGTMLEIEFIAAKKAP